MKLTFPVILLFLFLPAFPQVIKVKKIVWHNEALQSFFLHTKKQVPFLNFRENSRFELAIQPEDPSLPLNRLVIGDWYSASYAGHRYLFEKEYAALPTGILKDKLDSLRRKDCYDHSFEGRIYADHIDIKVTSKCPGKSAGRIKIFKSTETEVSYDGGPAGFQQVFRGKLAATNYLSYLQGDSVFFFRVLIRNDSFAREANPHDGEVSPLRTLIARALTAMPGWKPYSKDGKRFLSYPQVFIHIRKDGEIIADYYP